MKTTHILDEKVALYFTCVRTFGSIEMFKEHSFSIEDFSRTNHLRCNRDAWVHDELFPVEYSYEGIVELVLLRAQTTVSFPEALVLLKECGYCFVGFRGLAYLAETHAHARRFLPPTILAPHRMVYHIHNVRHRGDILGLPLLENLPGTKMLFGCSRKSTLSILQRHSFLLLGYPFTQTLPR